MALMAVRFIDVAIFGTLGGLWLGGAVFIVFLYRWILRWEREQDPTNLEPVPAVEPTVADASARSSSSRAVPRPAMAHEVAVAQ